MKIVIAHFFQYVGVRIMLLMMYIIALICFCMLNTLIGGITVRIVYVDT